MKPDKRLHDVRIEIIEYIDPEDLGCIVRVGDIVDGTIERDGWFHYYYPDGDDWSIAPKHFRIIGDFILQTRSQ